MSDENTYMADIDYARDLEVEQGLIDDPPEVGVIPRQPSGVDTDCGALVEVEQHIEQELARLKTSAKSISDAIELVESQGLWRTRQDAVVTSDGEIRGYLNAEEWATVRFGFTSRMYHYYLQHGRKVDQIAKSDGAIIPPSSIRQTIALAESSPPGKEAEVWTKALAVTKGKPTGDDIRTVGKAVEEGKEVTEAIIMDGRFRTLATKVVAEYERLPEGWQLWVKEEISVNR